ncbi:MAG: sigma-70 family RNA polymerase sigma factor [Sandaracinus sp.]|nr:sigma-70 family RNA polymerase sigma factor [Sandaracinus sp.]MCB9631034.1 sigma-70 family RNA polymerase sigma factor [Sandaracinus sp.]
MSSRRAARNANQADLLRQAREGDPDAMQALLSRLSPSVHRHGLALCRHEADAMEVLQDTLLAVASKLGKLEHDAALSSWVFALARTACNRRRRNLEDRVTKVELDASSEPDRGATPEEKLEAARVGRTIARALCSLPQAHREVLVLRELVGLSAEDAAARLEVSVAAFKSRLHRARAALREAFEQLDPSEQSDDTDVWTCATDVANG